MSFASAWHNRLRIFSHHGDASATFSRLCGCSYPPNPQTRQLTCSAHFCRLRKISLKIPRAASVLVANFLISTNGNDLYSSQSTDWKWLFYFGLLTLSLLIYIDFRLLIIKLEIKNIPSCVCVATTWLQHVLVLLRLPPYMHIRLYHLRPAFNRVIQYFASLRSRFVRHCSNDHSFF